MKKSKSKTHSQIPERWLGMDEDSVAIDLSKHLHVTLGRDEQKQGHLYLYNATVLTIRDRLVERWRETRAKYRDEKPKRVAYLSLEFLMGRTLTNAVLNLNINQELKHALKQYAVALEELAEEERDAGLGNGGLGRLAACFLDS